MPVVYPTSRVYFNDKATGSMLKEDEQVWPPVESQEFSPLDLANLTVWLDASQLGLADGAGVSPWTDLSGNGNHGSIVGTPAPVLKTATLNGLSVVRFKVNEGRVRGDGMVATALSDLTIIYVGRQWGTNIGRIFTNRYPPYNFLVGAHSAGYDACYDNGWLYSGGAWGVPMPWRIWSYTFTYAGSIAASSYWINGVFNSTAGSSTGHDSHWNLSGYDEVGTQETCDCEVAELITYARNLPDAERIQVQDYLKVKWGI